MSFNQLGNRIRVSEHRHRLFERLEVIRTDQDRVRRPVLGDDDAFMVRCTRSMNSEKRSRTVRKDSLDMGTIVPHLIGDGKTDAARRILDRRVARTPPQMCTSRHRDR
jgi:hypothetical protein